MNTLVKMEKIGKSFGRGPVLMDFDLIVRRGEVLGILGPNGAGKSTILRLIAGLESPESGSVSVTANRIGYVFQEPRLLPWDTVLRNVALPVMATGAPFRKAMERARHFLSLMALSSVVKVRPHQLSGGMRQRVALARAFAIDPDLLLLDEPFTGLDRRLRTATKALLESTLATCGTTVVQVTHDPGELIGGTARTITLTSAYGTTGPRRDGDASQTISERFPVGESSRFTRAIAGRYSLHPSAHEKRGGIQ